MSRALQIVCVTPCFEKHTVRDLVATLRWHREEGHRRGGRFYRQHDGGVAELDGTGWRRWIRMGKTVS